MRVSSPPSQKHSARKSTATLVPVHCGTLAQIYKSFQPPSIDQRKVNHMMHWWQKYLSERLHPACTDMKEVPADKTKSVNMTPKTRLVSPVKLIQWFWRHISVKFHKKFLLFSLHTLYSNQIAQHSISWLRQKYAVSQVTWSTWSISPKAGKM